LVQECHSKWLGNGQGYTDNEVKGSVMNGIFRKGAVYQGRGPRMLCFKAN
jgi:hypothetical protein